MQVEDGAGLDSGIKIMFKSAFKRLMETVDLGTGEMNRAELENLKAAVKKVSDAKSVYVRSKWPQSIDSYFSSSIGQITFPAIPDVLVSVEGCSNGYVKRLGEVSSRSQVPISQLGDYGFIEGQINEAIRKSVFYKSMKLYLVGKASRIPHGDTYTINKLNLGMNARSEALFFMTTVNRIERRTGTVSVYVNNVKVNTTPWEPLDADYIGLEDASKARLVLRALHVEIVRGGLYTRTP